LELTCFQLSSGSKGTPISLAGHTTTLTITTDVPGQTLAFHVLDILYMMKTKLHHCTARTLPRDLEDLQLLLTNYRDEVGTVADQLDDDDTEFFLDLEYVKMQDLELQTRYRALLGLGKGKSCV
jgi:hypothetical protein